MNYPFTRTRSLLHFLPLIAFAACMADPDGGAGGHPGGHPPTTPPPTPPAPTPNPSPLAAAPPAATPSAPPAGPGAGRESNQNPSQGTPGSPSVGSQLTPRGDIHAQPNSHIDGANKPQPAVTEASGQGDGTMMDRQGAPDDTGGKRQGDNPETGFLAGQTESSDPGVRIETERERNLAYQASLKKA